MYQIARPTCASTTLLKLRLSPRIATASPTANARESAHLTAHQQSVSCLPVRVLQYYKGQPKVFFDCKTSVPNRRANSASRYPVTVCENTLGQPTGSFAKLGSSTFAKPPAGPAIKRQPTQSATQPIVRHQHRKITYDFRPPHRLGIARKPLENGSNFRPRIARIDAEYASVNVRPRRYHANAIRGSQEGYWAPESTFDRWVVLAPTNQSVLSFRLLAI